ncbi:MAG: hypothetical protein ACYCVZ_11920 [Streptosporangiaceae bacterium]
MANQADPGTTMGSAAPDSTAVQAAGSESAQAAGSESAQAAVTPDRPYDLGELAPGALLPSQLGGYESFHGRKISWIAISILIIGFLVGGLALIFGSIWWLFWTGVGFAALGLLIAVGSNIFEDWY